jgi:uncharacterized protein DUF4168
MGRQLSAFVMIVAALFVGSSAAAQSPDQLPAPSARPVQISDDELQTFAKIYTDLQQSKSKHQAMLASAQTEEEAAQIRARFEEETTATLSSRGWTVDKFNSFVRTINSDPELAERASALIKD